MTIAEKDWDAAVEAIRGGDNHLLACHLGPDGDALGSMLALGIALRKAGYDVAASWGSEPFTIPKQYSFLSGGDLLVPPEKVSAAPPLMVTFDAGSIERLGSLESNARAATELVVVDHHRSNAEFGTINLIDPDAAASAVLTHELLRRMDLPLDREIARCLYTGLVTDTGRFQYRNTSPSVHEVAADLLSYGIDHDEIARLIYDTHPYGYLKLLSVVLAKTELNGAGMIWTWVTQKDLTDAGVEVEDTESLIDVVRTAQEADVAAVLKQSPEGNYKVSMRSKGSSDVGAVCEALGGGGHALAAGFTSALTDPRAIVEMIADRLQKASNA